MNQFYPRYLLISALCCWLTLGKAQQLIDVAGNGTPAFSGDNGPALNAALNGPSSFVVTRNNELWIADIDNHRIRVINLNTGIIRTVAGTGTASFSGDGGAAIRATFNQPKDLFQQVDGHILVTDPGNHRVRKIDPVNGTVTTVAGNGSSNYVEGAKATETGIPNPGSVTSDPQGNIYITDNVLRKVLRVDHATGTIKTFAGSGSNAYSGDGGQANDAGIPEPHVVRYHPVHGILLSDIDANVIRRISLTTGIIATIAGDGNPGYSGDGGPATMARLNIPLDMNIDSAGNIYVADGNNHVIRKLDHATGLISTIAGTGEPGYDGPNIFYKCSRINVPVAVVWSPDGLIYIGEWDGLRIRKIDPTPVSPTRPSARISQLPPEICPGQPLLLTVERVGGFAGELEMEWFKNGRSTGYFGESVTLPTINTGDVISLRIRGKNNTCGTDSVSVQTVPLTLARVEPAFAEIRGDSSLCPQQDALFTASSNYRLKDINWTVNNITRAQGNSFRPSGLADGYILQFRARVDTTGCLAGTQVFSRPMAIEILPAPPLALTPADTSIALGNAVTLQAETEPGITQFRWTGTGVLANGGNVQTLQPERTGTYTVSITSNLGCVQTASARVRVIRPVYIPNSFTPNADGKNDLFRVPPDIDIDMVSLKVFNRFGQLVWSTADPGAGWDGKINGQPAPVGSYAYLLTYREDKTIVERKGTVTLIR